MKKSWKIFLIVGLGILLAVGFRFWQIRKGARPNIVLIVIDCLRADHLPFYGYHKNTAPFLSELAAQSVIFKRAYSASTITSAAMASLFTSAYPFQHHFCYNTFGAGYNDIYVNSIPEEAPLLAEFLRGQGYRCFGIPDNAHVHEKTGFARGFSQYQNSSYRGVKYVMRSLETWWFKIVHPATPYFLYIHFMDPHLPYHARLPWYQENGYADMAAYDSEINYLDVHFQRLFYDFGWDKNTLLIVTADHGEEFREHSHRGHGINLYNPTLRIPLMFYYPGRFAPALVDPGPVTSVDIFPTIRDLLGAGSDPRLEGLSLLPAIKGEKIPGQEDRYLFGHLSSLRKKKFHPPLRSVIQGDWKLIRTDKGSELYDLSHDPGEKDNLAGLRPDRLQHLSSVLDDFLANSHKYKPAFVEIHPDEDQEEQLRSLGYLQ